MTEDIQILPLFSDDDDHNKKTKSSQKTIMEQLEMQQTIRENSTEISQTMNELKHFVNDIKQKEHELKYNEPSKEYESISIGVTPTNETASLTFNSDNLVTKTPQQLAQELKLKGNACTKRNDFKKAIEYYSTAIETDSTDAAVFFSNRALCYLNLKQYEECIKDCTKSLDCDSKFYKSYLRRSTSYEALGMYKAALNDGEQLYLLNKSKQVTDICQRLKKLINQQEILELEVKNLARPMINRTYTTKLDGLGKESAFIIKPPHLRSSKPLKRKQIIEIKNNVDNTTAINIHTTTTNGKSSEYSNLINGNLNEKSEDNCIVNGKSQSIKSDTKLNGFALDVDFIEKSNSNQNEKLNHKNSKEMENIAIQSDTNFSVPEPPTTPSQFYSTWKSLNDSYKRYLYLKNIETKNFHRLVSAQFNSDICTEMLTVMNDHFIKNNEPALLLLALLTEMSKCNDSSIIGILLSENDKVALQNITNYIDINYLKQMNDIKTKFII